MGRKRKVGKPRGRNGGRKPIVPDQQERKSRSIYCSESEYELAKTLIALKRGFVALRPQTELCKIFLEAYTGRHLTLEDMDSIRGLTPGFPSIFQNLRILDVERACFWAKDSMVRVPEIARGTENLLKTGNLHGHPMPENPSELDRVL